ncbi:MAG: HEAT repeat domain-containing protein [Tepidisphaerales bacterium]
MPDFDWLTFLRQWNDEMLASPMAEDIPQDVRRSGWLGFPPATDDQIAATESRLQIPLPPSYKAFLRASNGWHKTSFAFDLVWAVEKVDWFRLTNPDAVSVYTEAAMSPLPSLGGQLEPEPDDEYFAYDQCVEYFREEHLKDTLQISAEGDGAAVYLLNPQVISKDGEWEAWFFANWVPGAHRYRSFHEMMEAEYAFFVSGDAKQPKGILGGLPDEYVGSPGSAGRRIKPPILSTDGPPMSDLLTALNDGHLALRLYPKAVCCDTDGQIFVARSEAEARRRVVEALGRRRDQSAVPPLIDLLAQCNDRQTREWTVIALGCLGGANAIDAIFSMIHADGNTAVHAMHALKKLAPARLKAQLLSELNEANLITQPAIAAFLAELNETRALPVLANFVLHYASDERQTAQAVANYIGAFETDGLETLRALLSNGESQVRQLAAHAVLRVHRPEAVDVLRPLVHDSDPEIRGLAEVGLKTLPRGPLK